MSFTFAHEKKLGCGYLYLNEGHIARTIKVTDSVLVDVDRDGNPLGVEILNLAIAEPAANEATTNG